MALDVDNYEGVDTDEEEPKYKEAQYPPVVPQQSAITTTGPVQEPQMPAPASPTPIQPISSAPSIGEAPVNAGIQPQQEYPEVPRPDMSKVGPQGWHKGLGALAVGMAGMSRRNPQLGQQVAHEVFEAPRERAQQEYQAAVGQRNTQMAQDLAAQKEQRESRKETSEEELRKKQMDMVPITTPGGTFYVPQKDAEKLIQSTQGNAAAQKRVETTTASKEKLAQGSLNEKVDEFKKTDDYKRWKTKLDDDTKIRVAQLHASLAGANKDKAPAAIMQTAIFANGGLTMLGDAEAAMDRLEKKGVFGSLPGNKIEDWIFGQGLVDPSLDAETRRDIGRMRKALGYTSSATMRAHTGRTSREIYDDFKKSLGAGQDWSALKGAMEETHTLLSDYSQAASDANIAAVREGRNTPNAPAAGPGEPPGPAKPGMKWQHRTVDGKTEWRQTPVEKK
jgi:hypothetical protein